MRKLRRLPWRIPKSHHSQPASLEAAAPVETCTRADREREREIEREIQREIQREAANAQPVAFAGGRYVSSRPARTPEIRRKARHHAILPIPALG